MTTTAEPVTFIFLQDPQLTTDSESDSNPRAVRLDQLNKCLNSLPGKSWPNNSGLSSDVQGKPIDTPAFITFAGDLCQTGGEYNALDQMGGNVPYYYGGWQLQHTRWLFDKDWSPPLTFSSKLTRTKYDKVFFGLGNHDLQSAYVPKVWWIGYNSAPSGSRDDFWRYQMWNFICQMHTGLKQATLGQRIVGSPEKARFPIPGTIDDGIESHDYDWKKHSFNYHVRFSHFSIIQLHRYGGDSMYGRANGLDWLRLQLASLGPGFPIIIIQHFNFDGLSINPPEDFDPETSWLQGQADSILKILQPYNIIALFVGHVHEKPTAVSTSLQVPSTNPTQTFDQFRPGMASTDGDKLTAPGGFFAIVRVAVDSFNIQYGTAPVDPGEPMEMSNTFAFNKPLGRSILWLFDSDSNNNKDYIGPLKNSGGSELYIDLGAVIIPAGTTVCGIAFYQKHNRIAPKLQYFNLDGSIGWAQNTDMKTDWCRPDRYCDTTSVFPPAGTITKGFRFVTWKNRFGVSLWHTKEDGSDGNWENASLDTSNMMYFQNEGGVNGMYVDTTPVLSGNPSWVVTGF